MEFQGFFGNEIIKKVTLYKTLDLMNSRGQDYKEIKEIKIPQKKLYFTLKIINYRFRTKIKSTFRNG